MTVVFMGVSGVITVAMVMMLSDSEPYGIILINVCDVITVAIAWI
jgi:hypothetical protein